MTQPRPGPQRRLVVTQNITLDGVVEATDGWFDVGAGTGGSADVLAAVQDQMAREVGFLVGRSTFEDMRGYWPHQSDDTSGITEQLNDVDKFVVSTTITDPAWQNSTILRGGQGLAAEIHEILERGDDGDVIVTGSIELCHALLGESLVDELRLFVHPVVLGRGRRLFPDGVRLDALTLVESRAFASGVTLQTYRLR